MACREINPTPKQYAIKSDWNECHGAHELQGMCVWHGHGHGYGHGHSCKIT